MPGAVFATPANLSKYGCRQTTQVDLQGREVVVCQYKGWTFSSHHSKIIDSATLEAMQQELCGGYRDFNMHLPPQIFGHDIMRCERGEWSASQ